MIAIASNWTGKVSHPFLSRHCCLREQMHFKNGRWSFQQGSASTPGVNRTQNWLTENVPAFILKEEWPVSSHLYTWTHWTLQSGESWRAKSQLHTTPVSMLRKRNWPRNGIKYPHKLFVTPVEHSPNVCS